MASHKLIKFASPWPRCQNVLTRRCQGVEHQHKSSTVPGSAYSNISSELLKERTNVNHCMNNRHPSRNLTTLGSLKCLLPGLFDRSRIEFQRQYSIEVDSTDVQGRSLDKKNHFLIEKWYLEDAVDLVKRSVTLGVLPSGNTMVNLLKHLTDIGDVENSIELTSILLEHHLVLKKNIFPHLSKAFYNSGQIQDGVEFMEMTYNATKKFEDIESLFALIATLTFREFPEKSELIETFVMECTEGDKYKAMVHLWKCYMLAEHFEKADKLLDQNKDEFKSLLPVVINEICQMKDKVKVDREVVMSRLCEMENLSKKQRAYAYESLLNILDSKRNWKHLHITLLNAHSLALPLPKIQIKHHIKNLEVAAGDGETLSNIEELKKWSEIL